jgi:putative addiction module component (TIGR02574 family)
MITIEGRHPRGIRKVLGGQGEWYSGLTRRRTEIMNPGISSVFDLSVSEKLQLVEDLWDDIGANPEAIPVHDWQKEELDRRKANLQANPGSGLTWDEVQRRVRSLYGR